MPRVVVALRGKVEEAKPLAVLNHDVGHTQEGPSFGDQAGVERRLPETAAESFTIRLVEDLDALVLEQREDLVDVLDVIG